MRTMSPFNNVIDRMVTLSRAMDDVIGAPANGGLPTNGSVPTWAPSLDATETEQGWVVTVDLPGIAPTTVDVTSDRNTLTVRGSRERVESENARAGIRERAMGTFERSLRFPQHVDGEKISAGFEHGVLLADPDGHLQGASLGLRNVRYLTFAPDVNVADDILLGFVRAAADVALLPAAARAGLALGTADGGPLAGP